MTTLRIATIEPDAVQLERILANSTVRAMCGGLDGLPSAPRVYLELARLTGDPRTSLGALGHVIESDPGISASVLQLVGSASFGRSRRMVSIQQAIGYLGVELLKGLVLSAHLARAAAVVLPRGVSIAEFQQKALRVARLAHAFVANPAIAENAFTASLLIDVGQIVLALKHPEAFAQIAERARESARPLHDVEAEVLGVTHGDLGAYLLSLWGLPPLLVECVAFHHRPSWIADGPIAVRAVVHAADTLVQIAQGELREEHLDLTLLHRAGYLDQLDRWRALVTRDLAAAAT